jgi:hypothetical protein
MQGICLLDLVMCEFMVPPGALVPEPHYHEWAFTGSA